jgi:adenosylhomocysteine nucleosidase
MICYAFPLAHEAEPLLRRCTQRETFSLGHVRCTLGNYRDRQILIALVGMGRDRAAAGAELIFTYFRPRAFVLAGYGGALIPALKVGQVAVSGNYSTSDVVPFVKLLSGFDFASFVTVDEIAATPAERDRLARASRGQVVDMETSAVYDVVYPREIPFIAVRVISDEYAHVLPVRALAAGFDPGRGRATPLRLLAHLALHWGDIPPFVHFVRNLGIARRALLLFLTQLHDDLPRNI